MPQVSLYMDNATYDVAKQGAKRAKLSVSKFVCHAVQQQVAQENASWPRGYWELFGASSVSGLERAPQPAYEWDAPRDYDWER
jgi:hypothetical protein